MKNALDFSSLAGTDSDLKLELVQCHERSDCRLSRATVRPGSSSLRPIPVQAVRACVGARAPGGGDPRLRSALHHQGRPVLPSCPPSSSLGIAGIAPSGSAFVSPSVALARSTVCAMTRLSRRAPPPPQGARRLEHQLAHGGPEERHVSPFLFSRLPIEVIAPSSFSTAFFARGFARAGGAFRLPRRN